MRPSYSSLSQFPLLLIAVCQTVSQTPAPGHLLEYCESNGVSNDELPVCVFGGGITGLTVATKLEDAGYKVLLLEKSFDHVGGKMDTEATWNAYWEKGPVIFYEGEEYVKAYLNRFGVKYGAIKGSNVAVFNPFYAKPIPIPPDFAMMLRRDWDPLSQRFAAKRDSYPSFIFAPGGFTQVHTLRNSHPDLFLTSYEWLVANDLRSFSNIFSIIFTSQGYGQLADLPALYMLKHLSPPVLDSIGALIQGNPQSKIPVYYVDLGFRELAYQMANKLTCAYLGTKVVRTSRQRTDGITDFDFKSGVGTFESSRHCRKVVFAFPPILDKMVRVMRDMTRAEKKVLSKVKVHKYFSSGHLLETPAGDKDFYFGAEDDERKWTKGDGKPVYLVSSGNGTINKEAFTIYSWIYGSFDTGPSQEDVGIVDDYLRLFVRKFSSHPPHIAFLDGYEHFPHVSNDSIADGWFAKLDQIQGYKGTFYANTVSSFDSVNGAIETGEVVADMVLKSLATK